MSATKKRSASEVEHVLKSNKIYRRLERVLDSFGDFKYFDMGQLDDATLREIEVSLVRFGVVVLKNAIAERDMYRLATYCTGEAIGRMFEWQLTDTEKKELLYKGSRAIEARRNCKDLGFGNASFGFVLKHLRASYPSVEIGGEKVELDLNYGYNLNLDVLNEAPAIFPLLCALAGQRCEVSCDSFKDVHSTNPKPKAKTKPELTKLHIDKYDASVEGRLQAMIVAEEETKDGAVRLGFVPGASRPEVRELIAKLEPELYSHTGFNGVKDTHLVELLERRLVAAPYGSLVIWRDGLPHAEANFKLGPDGIHRFHDRSETPNQHRVRFVVGVHRGRSKTPEETLLLANLAAMGVTHAVYSASNKRTAYGRANIVDGKTTQWKKPREVPPEEDRRIEAAIVLAKNEVDQLSRNLVCYNIGARKAWMMGVDCVELDGTESQSDIVRRFRYLSKISTEIGTEILYK